MYLTEDAGGNSGFYRHQRRQRRLRAGLECHPQGRSRGELTLFFESAAACSTRPTTSPSPRAAASSCARTTLRAATRTPTRWAPGITDVNRLVGLTPEGEPFEFAVDVLNETEFTGACFSPAHPDWLFLNIFGAGTDGSGMTCAITGPWERGSS